MLHKITAAALALLNICLVAPLQAKPSPDTLKLPLRVHLITGVEMIRELEQPDGDPVKTVMGMPLTVATTKPIMDQVNAIWAPSGIEWVTDLANGGGGIVAEKAGGGRLTKERLKSLTYRVVARDRESRERYMDLVFPALADPANNKIIGDDGRFNKAEPEMYHLYLFPYVGQTLQGTAKMSGTFAVVGVFSDKRPNQKGLPKLRPHVIPATSKPVLSIANFPKTGALSATIAHELGHNLSLIHRNGGLGDNLMKGHVKLRLGRDQIAKARKQAMNGPRLKPTGAK